jgi:Raf kinase inhibitor-like YbhB/YbcL family protein
MPDLELTSTAFDDGSEIPLKYTCDGDDASPPLAWTSVPEATRALALIVHDPDAPSGDFTHWVAWNIDPEPGALGEDLPPPVQGSNDFGEARYQGPCPPSGSGPHRYVHELFALDTELDLEQGASRDQLENAMDGHVLAGTELMGIYERR